MNPTRCRSKPWPTATTAASPTAGSDRSAASGKSQDEVAQAMLATVPAGRFAEAEEPGGVIAFLCAPAAAYVNGQSIAVDGGRMQSI